MDQTVSISLFTNIHLYDLFENKKKKKYLFLSWKHFEDKYVCWLLMKSDARKHKDPIFGAFHKLNLEDAAKYVNEVRAELLIQHSITSFYFQFSVGYCSIDVSTTVL